ncbi:unnamed protein product [Cyprideis torosa]|uniref:GMP synthase (glutamine-hydrolyzing) n=1 Tax=Cyprideis torosa TaxID=163714 RepID=A0A7R8W6L2_9CRUS|nr:unnamed protein product [Cyprideis torosa]CAG0881898.1 unnamed protein product [Cyprideis torosa]
MDNNQSRSQNGMSDVNDRVAILDAGSQYGKVIDRRVRELFVESEMLPLDTTAEQLKEGGYKAIIISGGPGSIFEDESPHYDKAVFSLGVPILGICYGLHMIVQEFGGVVSRKSNREDGQFFVNIDSSCPIFSGLDSAQEVLLTHGDQVEKVPPSFKVIAKSSDDDIISGISNDSQRIYGLQFHPEVDLTQNGVEIMRRFLFNIASCRGSFTIHSREEGCIQYIKERVGRKKVLMMLSGGVDSTVCAALLHRALSPEQVVAIHINNGFMREDESSQVEKSLLQLGLKIKCVNAAYKFFNATTTVPVQPPLSHPNERRRTTKPLCQVTDPETKRKIIGDTFIKVRNPPIVSVASPLVGTLRPDLIESASILASGKADVIKTHHNDSELVRRLREEGNVVEPLKDFHKDEVRLLGSDLGLPSSIVQRHPFPGPGLAIRIICAEEPFLDRSFSETQVIVRVIVDYESSVKRAHALLNRVNESTSESEKRRMLQISKKGGLNATILPIQSVGVQGDHRTYSYVCALSTLDPDWSDLFFLAKLIPRVCHNVNRVVYLFGKPFTGMINDVTPTYLNQFTVATLRQADHLANQVLVKHNMYTALAQMPVILVPIHFDRDALAKEPSCQRSIILRPFITNDFMTGIAAVPGKHIPLDVVQEMVAAIQSVPNISRVMYDMTSKPPGTTEWE